MVEKIDRIVNMFGRNFLLKLLALFLAVSAWWFVSRENKALVSFNVPLEIRNVPAELRLTNEVERRVEVRLQGPASLLSRCNPSDISVTLNLSDGTPGRQTVKLDLQAVKVPAGVQVQEIFPKAIDIVLERTERRGIPVSVKIKGWESIRHQIRTIEIDPSKVEVEALPKEFFRIPVVYTQEIEVNPATDIFTTDALVELSETHAKITSDPNIRVKIYLYK